MIYFDSDHSTAALPFYPGFHKYKTNFRSEKETLHWKVMLESVAFNNGVGGSLSDLQLTRDDIPVIVEQCVNFVFRHGCMTEGIYRWVASC